MGIKNEFIEGVKNRFSIFRYLKYIIPLLVIVFAYIYQINEVKSLKLKIAGIDSEKRLLIEEKNHLLSDYKKLISKEDIIAFAQKKLKMKVAIKKSGYFAVYDKNDYFKTKSNQVCRDLFSSDVNLATIEK